jgi:hypothetical protein
MRKVFKDMKKVGPRWRSNRMDSQSYLHSRFVINRLREIAFAMGHREFGTIFAFISAGDKVFTRERTMHTARLIFSIDSGIIGAEGFGEKNP